VSAEHAGKSDEAARFKAEVTRLVGQGYTMDEVARIFRIRNGRQREAFKRKYAPPAVSSAVPSSPAAPGPAVPTEGHEERPLSDGFLEQIATQARELSEAGHAWINALNAKRPDRRLYNKYDALCADAGRGYMIQVSCLIAEIKRLKSALQAARREAGEI
jgi:hypothetical protein